MRHSFLLFLSVVVMTTAAQAANLVQNGTFDSDLDNWSALVSGEIEWSPVDEQGSPMSGSMQLSGIDADIDVASVGQCIPVVPGTQYAFGASVFLPSGQGFPSIVASTFVRWSSHADCSIIDLEGDGGNTFVRLEDAWGTVQGWATAPPGAQAGQLLLRLAILVNQDEPMRGLFDNAFFLEDATCGPTATALCLNQGRFRVMVEWETDQGDAGFGQAVVLTDDSGYFWFFNEDNVELVAKLLDGCPTQFNTFWFFAAGLTDVATRISVLDTLADEELIYESPQKVPFAPIQDTEAFATCP